MTHIIQVIQGKNKHGFLRVTSTNMFRIIGAFKFRIGNEIINNELETNNWATRDVGKR